MSRMHNVLHSLDEKRVLANTAPAVSALIATQDKLHGSHSIYLVSNVAGPRSTHAACVATVCQQPHIISAVNTPASIAHKITPCARDVLNPWNAPCSRAAYSSREVRSRLSPLCTWNNVCTNKTGGRVRLF